MPHRRAAPLLVASCLALQAVAAGATPLDDRTAALRVLGEAARIERTFSNCRWIRGRPDAAGLALWRRDNADFLAAARRVLDAQGGYTTQRKEIAEGLSAADAAATSDSRAACESFQGGIRSGRHDIGTLLPSAQVRAVLAYVAPEGVPALWRLEHRRGTDGVLRHSAVRIPGDEGVAECDRRDGAGKGHIHLRQAMGIPDPDPDLWLAECLESPVDPVTGAPQAKAEAAAGDAAGDAP